MTILAASIFPLPCTLPYHIPYHPLSAAPHLPLSCALSPSPPSVCIHTYLPMDVCTHTIPQFGRAASGGASAPEPPRATRVGRCDCDCDCRATATATATAARKAVRLLWRAAAPGLEPLRRRAHYEHTNTNTNKQTQTWRNGTRLRRASIFSFFHPLRLILKLPTFHMP